MASNNTMISPMQMQDELKVTYHESTLVFPSLPDHDNKKNSSNSFFLNNIDQLLNYTVPSVRFFHHNPDFPLETVAERLKQALEKVLVAYDFMAGRLRWNHQLARLEIECNGAGVGFVVASSELSLDQIGDLASPNLGFRQLSVETLDNLQDKKDDKPICVLQVTSFKCGGFAIGMSNNHILLDGLSAKMFFENLASQTFDDDRPLPFIPCHDRHLLAARSPPIVSFPHPEFVNINNIPFNTSNYHMKPKVLDFKLLKLSSRDISFLKSKAKKVTRDDDDDDGNAVKISTFNVVAALIWRCRALSSSCNNNSILNVIDIRHRMDPPLPHEYCGNAVVVAHTSADLEDIQSGPFSKLVEMVSQGLDRVNHEYARSAIDWLEINKGILSGDCLVSSWLRLGLHHDVFPWGKLVYLALPVNPLGPAGFCLRPDLVDGINIQFALPAEDIQTFQFHFRNFLEHSI